MPNEPPDRLRLFLRDHVSSYEALEVLLLLARDPQVTRTAADLASAMNVSVEPIAEALESLRSSGLLELARTSGSNAFRFAPRGEDEAERVAELQRVYAEQRLLIVQLMNANALQRVRSSAARRLADAFRLERPKK